MRVITDLYTTPLLAGGAGCTRSRSVQVLCRTEEGLPGARCGRRANSVRVRPSARVQPDGRVPSCSPSCLSFQPGRLSNRCALTGWSTVVRRGGGAAAGVGDGDRAAGLRKACPHKSGLRALCDVNLPKGLSTCPRASTVSQRASTDPESATHKTASPSLADDVQQVSRAPRPFARVFRAPKGDEAEGVTRVGVDQVQGTRSTRSRRVVMGIAS